MVAEVKMQFGRSAIVGLFFSFVLAVALFNFFFAIRPWTASPPPIKEVPYDIVQHSDWAQANYIAQGPYLESRFGQVSIHSQEGQLVPGPVFFQRTSSLSLIIDVNPIPEGQIGNVDVSTLESERLFASGSDTHCVESNNVFDHEGNQRCELQVFVSLMPLPEGEALELIETDLSPNKIALVDSRLLRDEKK